MSGVCVDGWLSEDLQGQTANSEGEPNALCIVCARVVLPRGVARGILGFSLAMATDMIMLSIECLVDVFVTVEVIWMDMLQSVCSFVLLISSE